MDKTRISRGSGCTRACLTTPPKEVVVTTIIIYTGQVSQKPTANDASAGKDIGGDEDEQKTLSGQTLSLLRLRNAEYNPEQGVGTANELGNEG